MRSYAAGAAAPELALAYGVFSQQARAGVSEPEFAQAGVNVHGGARQAREGRFAAAGEPARCRARGRYRRPAAAGISQVVQKPRLAPARAPARPAGEYGRAALHPADRPHRLPARRWRASCRAWWRWPRRKRGRGERGIHTLYVSPLKALAVDVARNLLVPAGADATSRQRRDAHRRYLGLAQAAPARAPARHPAHHARADRAAAVACGRAAHAVGSRHGHPRRAARAQPHQARRPLGARSRPSARRWLRAICASVCRPRWRGRPSFGPT